MSSCSRGASFGSPLRSDELWKLRLSAALPTCFRFQGQRYDCGSKLGFLQATVAYGMAHAEVGPIFREHLNGLSIGRIAAE